MAVTAKLYGAFVVSVLNKEIDINTDAIKAMVCSASYTPDQDTHDYKNDVTNEVSGTGYPAGGFTVANVTVTYTAGTNVIKVDGDDISESGVTFSGARYLVLYDSSPGTDATRPLVGYVDFGEDRSVTAADFDVTWHANGIATVTVA